jgi:hypothetical protein
MNIKKTVVYYFLRGTGKWYSHSSLSVEKVSMYLCRTTALYLYLRREKNSRLGKFQKPPLNYLIRVYVKSANFRFAKL